MAIGHEVPWADSVIRLDGGAFLAAPPCPEEVVYKPVLLRAEPLIRVLEVYATQDGILVGHVQCLGVRLLGVVLLAGLRCAHWGATHLHHVHFPILSFVVSLGYIYYSKKTAKSQLSKEVDYGILGAYEY